MKDLKKIALTIIDGFFINLAYFIAFYLIFNKAPKEYFTVHTEDALFITLVYIGCLFLFKLYDSLWTYASVDEFLLVAAGSISAGFINMIYVKKLGQILPMNVHIVAVILSTIFILGFRISFRLYRRRVISVYLKQKRNMNRVMVVGAGFAGNAIIRDMIIRKEVNYNPVALIDDNPDKYMQSISGVKVLGNRYDIKRIAKEKRIDTILIAIPSLDNKNKAEIIDICKETGCKLQIMPSLYEIINGQATLNKIRDVNLEDLLGRDPIKLDNEGISDYLKDNVVLVTGGGGSIGSELCRQIALYCPKQLIIFDIYENNAYDIQNELKFKYPELNLKVLIGSIRDKKRLENIFSQYKPQVVFHAAAHKHVPLMEESPAEAIKNNVFGTLNLAEVAHKYNTKRFVMISTDKAVNPTNVMGASKRMCEMIVQAMDKVSNTEFVAVRFGNVLGSNGSVIPLFKKQIAQGGPVTVTHKDITRYFMLIPEAAQLVLQAGAFAKGGEIFVLDMGKPVKIYDLACDLIRLSGLELGRDIDIKVTGLRPGEKLYEELLMAEEGLNKTGHNKIFVGRPTFEDIEVLKRNLQDLRLVLENENVDAIRYKLKEMVPTYKEAATQKAMDTDKDGKPYKDAKSYKEKALKN